MTLGATGDDKTFFIQNNDEMEGDISSITDIDRMLKDKPKQEYGGKDDNMFVTGFSQDSFLQFNSGYSEKRPEETNADSAKKRGGCPEEDLLNSNCNSNNELQNSLSLFLHLNQSSEDEKGDRSEKNDRTAECSSQVVKSFNKDQQTRKGEAPAFG
jgi:hypothetical protein